MVKFYGFSYFSMKKLSICIVITMFLVGCAFPEAQKARAETQKVRVSKGEASAIGRLLGISADYCQITATKGITITEADRQAAREYCASDEAKIIELLRKSQ